MFKKIASWFKRSSDLVVPFELPLDEEEIFKKSKIILQQLDEYITASELESENLSVQLDAILSEQDQIRTKLKELNKPNSWHERNLLLKLDRLVLHGSNLRQRIELFSQNIKVYLNLMSKVEDIRVMRLNGLDTERIQNIWLEFQHSLETYKEKIATEAVTETREGITSGATEERLLKLRQQVFGLPETGDSGRNQNEEDWEKEKRPVTPVATHPALDVAAREFKQLISNKKLESSKDLDDEFDDELDDEPDDDLDDEDGWDTSVKMAKRLEEG